MRAGHLCPRFALKEERRGDGRPLKRTTLWHQAITRMLDEAVCGLVDAGSRWLSLTCTRMEELTRVEKQIFCFVSFDIYNRLRQMDGRQMAARDSFRTAPSGRSRNGSEVDPFGKRSEKFPKVRTQRCGIHVYGSSGLIA